MSVVSTGCTVVKFDPGQTLGFHSQDFLTALFLLKLTTKVQWSLTRNYCMACPLPLKKDCVSLRA